MNISRKLLVYFIFSLATLYIYYQFFWSLVHFYFIICYILGYGSNIYFSSNKWYMVQIEDMYMIVLNDTFGSKAVFIDKSISNIKTRKFRYDDKVYTLLKRVRLHFSERVKNQITFLEDHEHND